MADQDASSPSVSTTVVLGGPLNLKLTAYTWDQYVAPNLSKLTVCGVPDLAPLLKRSRKWLSHFVMNATFRVRYEEPERQMIFAFLRRAQAAIDEFGLARDHLELWVKVGRGNNAVTQILTALRHLEVGIAQLYQAFMLVRAVAQTDVFARGDKSPLDRLRNLYNSSKHSDRELDRGRLPPSATTPIWITNEGLAGHSVELSFAEIVALLEDVAEAADYYSNPPAAAIKADSAE